MELTGTAFARTDRMQEHTIPSTPLIFTPQSAPKTREKTEDELPSLSDADEGLDKYDVSTLACTD